MSPLTIVLFVLLFLSVMFVIAGLGLVVLLNGRTVVAYERGRYGHTRKRPA